MQLIIQINFLSSILSCQNQKVYNTSLSRSGYCAPCEPLFGLYSLVTTIEVWLGKTWLSETFLGMLAFYESWSTFSLIQIFSQIQNTVFFLNSSLSAILLCCLGFFLFCVFCLLCNVNRYRSKCWAIEYIFSFLFLFSSPFFIRMCTEVVSPKKLCFGPFACFVLFIYFNKPIFLSLKESTMDRYISHTSNWSNIFFSFCKN